MAFDGVDVFERDDIEDFKRRVRFILNDKYRMEPLVYRAISYCSCKIVDYLLQVGHLRFDRADGTGLFPIHVAAQSPFVGSAVDILLAHGANIDSVTPTGRTALHLAAESCNILAVTALLERGANPNIRDMVGNLPLDLAIGRTKSILERGMLTRAIPPCMGDAVNQDTLGL